MEMSLIRQATRQIGEKLLAWSSGEKRSSLENPATPLSFPAEWLLDIWNGGRTDSGIRVSEMTALQASVVYACVDLISAVVGSLPLNTYERIIVASGNHKRHAKSLAVDHPAFDLLKYSPNSEMSANTFKRTLQVHMLLWGNAYAELERDENGDVIALWPRNPARVAVRRMPSGEMVYDVYDSMDVSPADYAGDVKGTSRKTVYVHNMLHIPGLSLDGRVGQDVVWLARNAIGLALATEKYASKYFANGAAPLGYLKYPSVLKREDEEILKRAWQEAYGGENRHRTAVLQNGIEYVKIGSNSSEAQMIDARKQQWMEICPIFRVNPAMLGLLRERGSNAEQIGIEFVNYTIGPWLNAWEDELKRKLFPPAPRGRNANRVFFARFDTHRLTLPDAAAKKAFYAAGRQWGFLSADDIREMEDLNPIENGIGDTYWMPVNMTKLGPAEPDADDQPPASASGPKPGATADPSFEDIPPQPQFVQQNSLDKFYPLVRDAVGRAMTRRKQKLETITRIFRPVVQMIAEELRISSSNAEDALTAVVQQFGAMTSMNQEDAACEVLDILDRSLRRKSITIYIARHGETADDATNLTSGHRQVPLDETGQKEAARLAEYVSRNLPTLEAIYAPNVRRHYETALAVAKACGAPLKIDDDLAPWDVGKIAGRPSAELAPYENNPELVPPGGESLEAANKRTTRAVKDHLRAAAKTGQPRLLVMSHRSIRAAEEKLSGEKVTENLHTGGLVATDGEAFKELL